MGDSKAYDMQKHVPLISTSSLPKEVKVHTQTFYGSLGFVKDNLGEPVA